MKTNRFEEIIKRKLLGAEPPPYHEADWERMSAFMQSKHPPTFWQQYGQAVLYSSGMAAIVGLLIINLTQLNENKRLLTEIKEVRSQKTATAAIPKKDTIFVVQYRNQSIVNRAFEATNSAFSRQNKATTQNLDKSVGANYDTDNVQQNNLEVPKQTNLRAARNLGDFGGDVANNSKAANEQTGINKSMKAQSLSVVDGSMANNLKVAKEQTSKQTEANSNGSTAKNASEIGGTSNNNNSVTETTENKYEINIEPLALTELANLQTDLADGVKNKKLRVRTPDEMTWPTQPKNAKPVRLAVPPLRMQIGVSGQSENRLVGAGLSAEILIGKHWSVNIGLDAVRIGAEQFLSDEQFNQKHKKNFRGSYAPPQRVPATADILNINSSLRLVRLPVFVSYRYSLPKDFTLLLSAGSAFDLSVRENVSFNFRPNRQDFATETYDGKQDLPVFNNIFAGVAIEKCWGRFVVQAQPYIEVKMAKIQLPNQNDRDNTPQIGVRLRALYRFGK